MVPSDESKATAFKYNTFMDATRRAILGVKNIKDISNNINEFESIPSDEFHRINSQIKKAMLDIIEDLTELMGEKDKLRVESKSLALEAKCIAERNRLFDLIYSVIPRAGLDKSLSATLLNVVREELDSFKQFSRAWQMLTLGEIKRVGQS